VSLLYLYYTFVTQHNTRQYTFVKLYITSTSFYIIIIIKPAKPHKYLLYKHSWIQWTVLDDHSHQAVFFIHYNFVAMLSTIIRLKIIIRTNKNNNNIDRQNLTLWIEFTIIYVKIFYSCWPNEQPLSFFLPGKHWKQLGKKENISVSAIFQLNLVSYVF
jgi:hypothetical protein